MTDRTPVQAEVEAAFNVARERLQMPAIETAPDGRQNGPDGLQAVPTTAPAVYPSPKADRRTAATATGATATVTAAHLSDLTPDPTNRRQHNPRNVGLIVDALHHVGAARSIVIDEHGTILCGNATVDAASEAGITKVQVVDADGETIVAVRRRGLTDEQKRHLALADNRAAELATWDLDQLRADADAGLDLGAFWSDTELADLLGADAPTPQFSPVEPEHRLDQLRADVTCPRCGHQFKQEAR